MFKDIFNTVNIVCIITNKWGNIEYTNIDKHLAYNYLQKTDIAKNLTNLPMQYVLKNYCICIDIFYIGNQPHYITIVIPNYCKCNTCSKALRDIATGLYNRNYWEQFCEGIVNHLEVERFSLILIDIDNLKEINDSLGHLAGDKAIKIVGKSIKKAIREEDIGIRYGGDEFIVLLTNTDEYTAKKVVKRIQEELIQRRRKGDIDVYISVGVACNGCLGNIKDMIKSADKDLYREKQRKRGTN